MKSIAEKTNSTASQTASSGPDGAAIAPNQTGMPDVLKRGVEALSGISLEDVRVHAANSSKPADLQALTYAQGHNIHLRPEAGRHLPHEAWHIVQQKQGSVQQTVQRKAMQNNPVVQRYCSVPGCTDPKCNDPENHKISHFRSLRNVDIYNANRDKSDLGTGSDTNQKTRDYVQDSNSFYPEEVSLSYTNQDGSYKGGSSYVQPPRTPNMKPDAGHIFGNQYGGSGKDSANIFAQEPKHNRGNSFNGEKTFGKWRKTENEARKGIQKGHSLKLNAKLYRKKRRKYGDPSSLISDAEYREFMKKWYRKDDDHDKGGSGMVF